MKKQKDDIRELLGKIRKLQNENTQIDLTGVDEVKRLLETNKKRSTLLEIKLLNEEEEEKTNIQNLTPEEQREEENKFKDTVSKLVKFDPIKVYRQNVEWSGELVREKIKWIFSLDENNGCYITTESENMLQLTTEVIETLKKIKGYYDVWSDEWGMRLTGGSAQGQTPGTEEGGF